MKTLFATLLLVLAMTSHAGTVEDALAAPDRLPADLERDARSQPADILPLLAVGPGSRVADIFGGGGYYSELIGRIVTPGGEVLLHNNAAYLHYVNEALAARLEQRDVPGVTLYEREVDQLDLGEGTLDAALIIMSYHDLYFIDNDWPTIDAADFMGQIVSALKPGGRLLIVDHSAAPGSGTSAAQTLHRIEEAVARKQIEGFGLDYVTGSDALRNAEDDLTLNVFDATLAGKTDRSVLVFEKP